MILSLKDRLLSWPLYQNFPFMLLQPVLPEKRFLVRSRRMEGILPVAASEARTGCKNHPPPKVVVSGILRVRAATIAVVSAAGAGGLEAGSWQASRKHRQAEIIVFIVNKVFYGTMELRFIP